MDESALRLRDLLLAWYRAEARPLAWRRTRDPYRILVAELMLQQTQVARVVPVWQAFCERWPTVADLAAASTGDVLTAWRGLGYNRRARDLHRAANVIVEQHGGKVPCELPALLALPGVGAYTARAVLAFAWGQDAAPVDINVGRVIARAVAGRPLARRELQELADALVPAGAAHAWSSALMDLGARCCVARVPRCATCPIAAVCAWQAEPGTPDPAGTSATAPRRQAPFAGSDRFHRGRLVDALRQGPVASVGLAAAARLADRERLAALTAALVAEGLAEWHGEHLRLPG